jgi:hypothetical protein
MIRCCNKQFSALRCANCMFWNQQKDSKPTALYRYAVRLELSNLVSVSHCHKKNVCTIFRFINPVVFFCKWGLVGPSKHDSRTIVIFWFDDDCMLSAVHGHYQVTSCFTINNNKDKIYTWDNVYLEALYISGDQRDLVVNGILLVRALYLLTYLLHGAESLLRS